ncbi:zinc-binding dehydrogenase [Amycolatopsis sp. CA-128772]|uniref:zinc-binding dehydrogenase n=1 Tax=Amycolatopsis sp. CA-128772 TaxID=2073159 RepID=UPI001E5E5E99|nr:zinc-binding dehydrogenase [Amycolatopsis sp. CA-128772]
MGELAGTPVWFATAAGMRSGDGSMAEYAVAASADVVPLPGGADHALVATLGLSAVAAWRCLTSTGKLAPGETVLVLGAGGVVGQPAVQPVRLAGAGRVVAGARSDAAPARAEQQGADAVVRLEADDADSLTRRLSEAAGPVDLVLDPVCGLPAAAALRTLRPVGSWSISAARPARSSRSRRRRCAAGPCGSSGTRTRSSPRTSGAKPCSPSSGTRWRAS